MYKNVTAHRNHMHGNSRNQIHAMHHRNLERDHFWHHNRGRDHRHPPCQPPNRSAHVHRTKNLNFPTITDHVLPLETQALFAVAVIPRPRAVPKHQNPYFTTIRLSTALTRATAPQPPHSRPRPILNVRLSPLPALNNISGQSLRPLTHLYNVHGLRHPAHEWHPASLPYP